MLAPPVTARSAARVVPVPKPGGVRWLTLLDRVAAAAYAAAVAEVAPAIEARLGPQVFANRVLRFSPLTLQPWRGARARFRRAATRLAGDARGLVLADVRGCFANIEPSAVREALARIGCHPGAAERIFDLLEGFLSWGIPGLPIGPEPSAVLANAVLCAADEAIAAGGGQHLRWVDDFVVAATDPAEADSKLERLRTALADFGLSLNQRKTRVISDPALVTAELLHGPVSDVRPADRLRCDAHAVSSLAGANLLPPPGRGLDPHRRAPHPARRRR